MSKYLPAICFALIPFGFWGQNIFFGQANTLILSGVLLLFLSEQNELKLNGLIKLMGAYLSGWIAFNFVMVLLNRYPQELSMATLDSVLLIFAGMIFFLSVYRGSLSLNAWSNLICFIATIQATLGILQSFGFDPIVPLLQLIVQVLRQMEVSCPTGTMGNPNFLAAYLAISLPFFFRGKWKWFIPIVVAALMITKTTTAMGAAIIGMVYYFFGKKWALLSIIPAFILYAIKYKDSIFSNARVEYWLDAWKSTSHSWQTLIFGWGPGITWKPGNTLHSEYVNTFFNYGLIGIILLIGYFLIIHKKNKMLFSAFIIICIDMLGNHALHITSTATLILLITALNEREQKEAYKCQ